MYARAAEVNESRGLKYAYVLTHIGKRGHKPKAPDPFPIPEKTTKSNQPKPNSFAGVVGSMMAATRRAKRGE